jgi:hypothetical protein
MSIKKDMANNTKPNRSSSTLEELTTKPTRRLLCYACITRLPERIVCNVCTNPQTQSKNMSIILSDFYISKNINEYINLRQVSYTCRKLLKLGKYVDYKLNKRGSLRFYSIKKYDHKYANYGCSFKNDYNRRLCYDYYEEDEEDDDDYYYHEDFDELEFRKKLLKKIDNPLKQLHLDFSFCNQIFDLSALRNVHTLDFSYCFQIRNVGVFANVHTLCLKSCQNLVNVNVLKNVTILDISYCRGVKDVSELGKVNTLKLKGCLKITDFTALENVPHLILP